MEMIEKTIMDLDIMDNLAGLLITNLGPMNLIAIYLCMLFTHDVWYINYSCCI